MRIKTLQLGFLRTNCYIVSNEDTKEAIIIDPAGEPNKIETYIDEAKLKVVGVLITHGHFDHIYGLETVVATFGSNVYASENEKELLSKPELNLSKKHGNPLSVGADIYLKDREVFTLAGFEIEAISTPGHTSGGACYNFIGEDVMFTGDTLFKGTVGRCDLPTSDEKKMMDSLDKLMEYDDDILIYPGHGYRSSIGIERRINPYIS